MTSGQNFSGQPTPAIVDTAYSRCNFAQAVAHTRIFPGDNTPRTFTDCNLVNCDLPPGSTASGCLWGYRTADPANDQTVTVDGVIVGRIAATTWTGVPN